MTTTQRKITQAMPVIDGYILKRFLDVTDTIVYLRNLAPEVRMHYFFTVLETNYDLTDENWWLHDAIRDRMVEKTPAFVRAHRFPREFVTPPMGFDVEQLIEPCFVMAVRHVFLSQLMQSEVDDYTLHPAYELVAYMPPSLAQSVRMPFLGENGGLYERRVITELTAFHNTLRTVSERVQAYQLPRGGSRVRFMTYENLRRMPRFESQGGVVSDLLAAMRVFGGTPDALGEHVTSAMDKVPMFKLGNMLAGGVNSVMDTLQKLATWMKEHVDLWVPAVIAAFSACWKLLKSSTYKLFTLVLQLFLPSIKNFTFDDVIPITEEDDASETSTEYGEFASAPYQPPKTLKEIRADGCMKGIYDALYGVSSQGGIDIVASVLKKLSVYYLTCGYDFKPTTKMFKEYSSVSRGIDDFVKDIITFVMDIFGSLTPRWVSSLAIKGGVPTDVNEWMTKAFDILKADATHSLVLHSHLGMEIRKMVDVGLDLISFGKAKGYDSLLPTLNGLVKQLSELMRVVEPRIATRSLTRPKPVVIMFIGESGQGKSNLGLYFSKLLAYHEACASPSRLEAFKANARTEIYVKGDDKFSDGMTSYQSVGYYDDFDQALSVRGAERSQGAEFIHTNNEATYAPMMANITDKNNVFTRFAYTVYTTNSVKIDDPTIRCPEAYGRRMDFICRVTRREIGDLPGFDPDRFVLEVCVPDTTNTFRETGERMSYSELFKKVLKKHEENVRYHETMNMNMDGAYAETVNWGQSIDQLDKIVVEEIRTKMAPRIEMQRNITTAILENKMSKAMGSHMYAIEFPDETNPFGTPEENGYTLENPPEFEHPVAGASSQGGRSYAEIFTPGKYDDFELGPVQLPLFREDAVQEEAWDFFFCDSASHMTYKEFIGEHPKYASFSANKFYTLLCALPKTKYSKTLVEEQSVPEGIPILETKSYIRTLTEWERHVVDNAVPAWRRKASEMLQSFRDCFRNSQVLLTLVALASSVVIGWLGLEAYRYLFPSVDTQDYVPSGYKSVTTRQRGEKKNSRQRATRDMLRDAKMHRLFAESQSLHPVEEPPKGDREQYRDAHSSVNSKRYLLSSESQGASEDLEALLRANLFTVDSKIGDEEKEWCHEGYATGLFGRTLIMPLHFLTKALHECDAREISFYTIKWRLTSSTGRQTEIGLQNIKQANWDDDAYLDAITVSLDDKLDFQEVRDVTKHMVRDDDVFGIMFAGSRKFGGRLVFPTNSMSFEGGWGLREVYYEDLDETKKNCLMYSLPSEKGWCGAPLISVGDRYCGKFVGIHVAGTAGRYGISAIISQSVLGMPTKKPIFDHGYNFPTIDTQSKRDYHGDLDLNFITRELDPPCDTHVTNNLVPWQPTTYSYFERKTLATKPVPSCFEKNRAAFGPVACPPLPYYEEMVPALYFFYNNHARHVVHRVLTLEESILGVPGTHFGPIDHRTSPGYPDTAFGVKGVDYWSIKVDGTFEPGPLFPEMVKDIQAFVDAAQNEAQMCVLIKDCMKGERAKAQKVIDGKVRFINILPKWFVAACRMYYGTVNMALAEGAPFNTILKGEDEKDSSYWTMVTKHLTSLADGKYVGAGDYSAFDHHQSRQMVELGFDVYDQFYLTATEHDKKVRQAIRKVITHQLHAYGSVVEEYEDGLPSGFFATSEFNCIINRYMFTVAWLDLHGGSIKQIFKFDDHVHMYFLGDDNIWATDEKYSKTFTPKHIADTVQKFGHVYTDVDKGPARNELEDISKATILKRSFRKASDGMYDAPLNLDVVLEMPLWTRSGNDEVHIAHQNMDVALRELSLHGKDVFNEWMPKMRTFAGRFWEPFSEDWWTIYKITTGR